MNLIRDIDEWMVDIEQELKFDNYVNRVRLQRKHIVLKALKDKLVALKLKADKYSNVSVRHIDAMSSRRFDNLKPPMCGSSAMTYLEYCPYCDKKLSSEVVPEHVQDSIDDKVPSKKPTAPQIRARCY